MKIKNSFFNRIFIGFKKGIKTPTLPDHILKFQSNSLIRIFRVLGGFSIISLLGHAKFDYFFNIIIIYLLFSIGFLFVMYQIVISYYRIKNIFKILKSDKLDIRNSPLDLK